MFGVAAVIMALAIFAMARRGVLSSRRLLDLGLVFQVGGALGIAVPRALEWPAAQGGIGGWVKYDGRAMVC